MTNEQKAQIRSVISALTGFCSEDAPEIFITAIVAAIMEGKFPDQMVNEAWEWVKEYEKRYEEDDGVLYVTDEQGNVTKA